MNAGQEIGKAGGHAVFVIEIMIHRLAEQGYFHHAAVSQSADLVDDLTGWTMDFRAAGVRDDAKSAVFVAPASDANIGLVSADDPRHVDVAR